MKTIELKFFRGNPQLKNGGYETTRTVTLRTVTERTISREVRRIQEACVYGSMLYRGYTVKE